MSGEQFKSTSLRSVRYNASTEMLEVELHAGGVYEFYGVPIAVYQGLMDSKAKDSYFERQIKPKFRHRRLLRV